jgi:hypothetical protein
MVSTTNNRHQTVLHGFDFSLNILRFWFGHIEEKNLSGFFKNKFLGYVLIEPPQNSHLLTSNGQLPICLSG